MCAGVRAFVNLGLRVPRDYLRAIRGSAYLDGRVFVGFCYLCVLRVCRYSFYLI